MSNIDILWLNTINVIIIVRNLQCVNLLCFDQVVSQASNPDWPLLRRSHVCDLRQLQVGVLDHQTAGPGEEWSHPVPGLYRSVSSHLLRIQVPGLLTRKCTPDHSLMNINIHSPNLTSPRYDCTAFWQILMQTHSLFLCSIVTSS